MQITQAIGLTPTGHYEELNIINAGVSSLDAAYIANAKGVFITVEDNNIRYRIDGGDPSATAGHLVLAGANIYFNDPGALARLKMISMAAGGSRAIATYYK